MKQIKNGLLSVNADAFIVPNRASVVREHLMKYWGSYFDGVRRYNGLNPVVVNSTKLIELWIVCKEDMDTDNLSDHGGSYIDENGHEKRLSSGKVRSMFPIYELLQDKSEGDTVTVKLPILKDDGDLDFILEMNLRLAQEEYRYRRFGRFDEVLKMVMQ